MPAHQPEGQTEHLAEKLQALARKSKSKNQREHTRNPDPDSNSGYPAGGERTPPGQDAYEKPTDEAPANCATRPRPT